MADRYRHRRPRYYDDDEDDTSELDNYPPPRTRRSDRDRAPPRPSGPPADLPPPPPPAPMPSAAPRHQQQQVRRPSILVSPDETPSERAYRRRSRSNSNVRLQASDDDDDDNAHRRVRREPMTSRRHDLEAKNGEGHQRFREKRDGYESDEGEHLRRSRKGNPRDAGGAAPPKPRGYPPPDEDEYGRGARQALPLRGKPRDPIETGVEYGGDAVAAGGADGGQLRRRRTYKDPSPRYNNDDYDSPRPRRRTTDFENPGYRSDHVRRDPPRPRPRRDYDDYYDDRYDRATPPRRRAAEDGYRSGGDRRPRPQDYYSDHREDRAPRRGDPRRYPRDDGGGAGRYDEYARGPRRYDDYDRRDPRDRRRSGPGGGGGMGGSGWQKEASAAFMAYAMPTIKKEGTKWAKKQLQSYLASKGGA